MIRAIDRLSASDAATDRIPSMTADAYWFHRANRLVELQATVAVMMAKPPPPPPLANRQCVICRKTFHPKFERQTTCGDKECARERNRRQVYFRRYGEPWTTEKDCCICGKKFIHKSRRQLICGEPECIREYHRRDMNDRRQRERDKMFGVIRIVRKARAAA